MTTLHRTASTTALQHDPPFNTSGIQIFNIIMIINYGSRVYLYPPPPMSHFTYHTVTNMLLHAFMQALSSTAIMPQSKPAPVYYDRWRLTARIICCIIYWAGDIPQSLITWCVAVRVGVVPEIYSWQINISSFNCTQVVCTFRKMANRRIGRGLNPWKLHRP